MFVEDELITWLASYPKSGNTWVRMLLSAYRYNGFLDINDIGIGYGDSAVCYTHSVSPVSIKDLGTRGQWLLRPAALMVSLMTKPPPRYFKTHFANITVDGLPAFIPRELTKRAIYMVRDPRSVVLSLSKFFGLPTSKAAEKMAFKDWWIGTDWEKQTAQVVSTWSNHVASWTAPTHFPVHVVKYEDLLADPHKELTEMIEFLEIDLNEKRIARAVKAAELSRLQKIEAKDGFKEGLFSDTRGAFFGGGGTRWKDELGPKWIKQIENDHGTVMEALGYK